MVRRVTVPQLAQGAFMPQGLATFPCPHKSPGREPGDCGTKGHPALHPNRAPSHPRSLLVAAELGQDGVVLEGRRVAYGLAAGLMILPLRVLGRLAAK